MKGVPLKRWGIGLTILLEKTKGNNHIHKMRAICLLEADFNFFNKTVYARRMMRSSQDKGQIPMECFARKGSNCVQAVMTKVMFCDKSRTHHHPTCIGGNDFGNCYNRIAHPPASIALQSWGVSRESVRLILIAMQTMQFYLRTGYGESTSTYGGSEEDTQLGLGQGNAAAGPGFMAVSAQIVNAYLRDGNGARTVTSYTNRPVSLAAVIYVDDSDLIHMTNHVTVPTKELIRHAQESTNAWGGLAIATGAALKPEKCFAYFLTYKYSGGRPSMGTTCNLRAPTAMIPTTDAPPRPSPIRVPLPDGSSAPIPTIPPKEAMLMLGIWFGPSSRGTKHRKEMCQKGIIWTDKLHSRPLPPSEAWISFTHQLCPGMLWGIATVVLSQHEFHDATRPVYFRCLPFLGVQRHIELPWRTLPEMYQGIGLPNFALLSLAAKLQLIQCSCGYGDAASLSLAMGYETFVMEIGMYGNTLGYNYKKYSPLATDGTWFKNIWELMNDFDVMATFN